MAWRRIPPDWRPDWLHTTDPNDKTIVRPLVYICCPRSDEKPSAMLDAMRYYSFALKHGAAPFCPTLYHYGWLRAEHGALIDAVELMMLHGMDEIWVFGDPEARTPSQLRTLCSARKKAVTIRHISNDLLQAENV